jgi:hypothetical protein
MFNEARSCDPDPPRRRVLLLLLCALAALAMHAAAFGTATVPRYRTQMAPPATLSYGMRNGWLSGTGELHWRPASDRYEVRLDAQVAGLHVMTETSTGSFDTHGIAPLRYTDKRLRRALTAAEFQRKKGRISYSGSHGEVPLPAGAQDRLSWMIQIGAVLNAEPQHAEPGGSVVFFVTGSRGDAEPWVFRCGGAETVQTPIGALRAVKFTRAPRRPEDKRVEVWLASEHHHLPVRARFTASGDGEVFELLLRDIQVP